MDKLLALKTFIEVADTAGFSRAARNLGVATSSVTRLIDLLEASLGTALLTRSTRQVVLTDVVADRLSNFPVGRDSSDSPIVVAGDQRLTARRNETVRAAALRASRWQRSFECIWSRAP
jgi:hypothetical protein